VQAYAFVTGRRLATKLCMVKVDDVRAW